MSVEVKENGDLLTVIRRNRALLKQQEGQRSSNYSARGPSGFELMNDAYWPKGSPNSPDIIRILPAMYQQEVLFGDSLIDAEWPFYTWR